MREYTIVDCMIVDVFDQDTENLIFLLKRSIELTAPKPVEAECEVCHAELGSGPGKCQPSKGRPSWCFECSMMRDDLTAEEVL